MTGAAQAEQGGLRARGQEPVRPGLILVLLPVLVVVVLGLPLAIRAVALEAFEIEGPSMVPALLPGDRVAVDKRAYGLFLPFTNRQQFNWGMPAPGDIVIVKNPADNVDIVKRVVGVGGDHISWQGDALVRNGKPLPREPAQCPPGVAEWGKAVCEIELCIGYPLGVNADGHREALGVDVVTTEDGASWTTFLLGLVALGLSGVELVISD